MKPHEERVVAEKAELDEKIIKLSAFIDSNPIYRTLPSIEQHDLMTQHFAMCEYSAALGRRISRFQ